MTSFLPWWVLRVRVGDDRGIHYQTHDGSAWRMSTRWTEAVLVTVAAVAVWVLWRVVRGRVPLPVRLVLLAAVGFALYLTVAQLLDVRDFSRGTAVAVVSIGPVAKPSGDPFVAGWMRRDHLVSYRTPGLYADVSDGCWMGLAAMVLVVVALLLAGSGEARPATSE